MSNDRVKKNIATVLPGFNDLGRSMTPTFFTETDFIYNFLHFV